MIDRVACEHWAHVKAALINTLYGQPVPEPSRFLATAYSSTSIPTQVGSAKFVTISNPKLALALTLTIGLVTPGPTPRPTWKAALLDAALGPVAPPGGAPDSLPADILDKVLALLHNTPKSPTNINFLIVFLII